MSGVAHDSRKTLAAFIMRPVGVLTLLAVLVTMGLIAYTRIPIQLLPAGWEAKHSRSSSPIPTAIRGDGGSCDAPRGGAGAHDLRDSKGAFGLARRSRRDPGRVRRRPRFGSGLRRDPRPAREDPRQAAARLDRYFIFRNSLDESTPIFFGGLLFDVEPTDPRVNDICENILKRRIEGVDGVARMDIHGMLEESIRILLDVDRVRAHRVNLVELVTRLARDNFAVPAGKLQDGDSKYMLRVDSRLTDLEEIRDIPIGEG